MKTKNFMIATIAGSVASFTAVYVVFGLLLQDYTTSHIMARFHKVKPNYIFMIIGCVLFSGLVWDMDSTSIEWTLDRLEK